MANGRIETLRHAVRWRVLLKYLGVLGLVLAVLDTVPLLASFVLGEAALAPYLAAPVVLLVTVCLPLARLEAPQRLQLNEAFAIVALSFSLGALAMSLPLAALGGQGWLDGLFEAVSGITTTGLSTLATVEDKSRTFLFARAWLQWYGGLGIVVLSLALFLHNGLFARQLMETEAVGETLVSSTWQYARRIAAVYAALTLAALGAIWLATGDGFGALVHAFAAVSTGGFSSFDTSLGHWGVGPAGVVLAFALLCAVALPLYYRAWHDGLARGPQTLARDAELRLLLVATALTTGLLWLWMPSGEGGTVGALANAALLAMSAQSTTGFALSPLSALDDASKLTLIASMLIGGSVGSTAGGFKLLRLLLLLRVLQLVLVRAAAPRHAVIEPRLGSRRLGDDDLWRALLVILLYVLVVFLSWLVFVAHGHPGIDALFEVVSATATVGLSTGIARPALEPLLKLVLCFDMLAGRVEIFALLVVLYPGTWFGKRAEAT
jgi:trk system potassium uptake protein TrkH